MNPHRQTLPDSKYASEATYAPINSGKGYLIRFGVKSRRIESPESVSTFHKLVAGKSARHVRNIIERIFTNIASNTSLFDGLTGEGSKLSKAHVETATSKLVREREAAWKASGDPCAV